MQRYFLLFLAFINSYAVNWQDESEVNAYERYSFAKEINSLRIENAGKMGRFSISMAACAGCAFILHESIPFIGPGFVLGSWPFTSFFSYPFYDIAQNNLKIEEYKQRILKLKTSYELQKEISYNHKKLVTTSFFTVGCAAFITHRVFKDDYSQLAAKHRLVNACRTIATGKQGLAALGMSVGGLMMHDAAQTVQRIKHVQENNTSKK